MSKIILFTELKTTLEKKIREELPGEKAHYLLSPAHRQPASFYLEKEKDYRKGCVMALLFPDNKTGEARLILMQRTDDNSVHAGQISFPGGKLEATDASEKDAALRETEEEIGVSRKLITVAGRLTELYIPPSKFLVYPFVGLLEEIPVFDLSTHEVAKILTPSLSLFKDQANLKQGDFKSARGYVVNAPYFEIEGVKIWGATAMIISELISLT